MEGNIRFRGRLNTFMRWPLWLSILLAAAAVIMFFFDYRAGVVMAGFFVAYVVITVALKTYLKPFILDDMVNFAADFSDVQMGMFRDSERSYAIIRDNGIIVWSNESFMKLAGSDVLMKNIGVFLPEIKLDELSEEVSEQHIKLNEMFLKVRMRQIDLRSFSENNSLLEFAPDGNRFFSISVLDETETVKTRRRINSQKLVCGIILVDNYEEAMNSTEEVRQSLLAALVDRKITKYMSQYDAIINKMEKDRYIFVMRQKFLPAIRSSKFSLLDEVREISIGNAMNVTLCIGLGMNGKSYAQCLEWARHALDLALGRGGDQAVIKDNEKISYYGGKTKQVEKSTRVRARVKAHAMRQVIDGKDNVIIMGHKNGDADCIGAAIGVYRAARTLNKRASIVINNFTPFMKPIASVFMNNSDYDAEMFINSEAAKKLVSPDTVIIVVDVNTADRTEAPELLGLTHNIVVIDHHRQSGQSIENPVLTYIEPYASSACEMVVEILQYIDEKVKLRPEEADALYAGIVIDTNHFLNETGVRTFEAAAFLKKHGADINRVKLKLRDDMKTSKARANAVNNAQVEDGFAYAVCPSEGLDNPTITGAQAANELLEISGIDASFVFTKIGEEIFVSARSLDNLNVQLIMEKAGGGGHTTIAGAQLKGMNIDEAVGFIKGIVKSMKSEGEI